MARFDAFLSYATEDEKYAGSLFDELQKRGFHIWFAPTQLKLGDPLFRSIEVAMTKCHYGILLISKAYLSKQWTQHEMDTLRRAAVEKRKYVLPVVLSIDKSELESKEPSLSNVITAKMADGVTRVADAISAVIASGSPTIGSIPIYMDPGFLFRSGQGEIKITTSKGGTATMSVFEFLLHAGADDYPLFLDGERYSKRHLAWGAAGAFDANPELASNRLQSGEIDVLKKIFLDLKIDSEEASNMPYFGDE